MYFVYIVHHGLCLLPSHLTTVLILKIFGQILVATAAAVAVRPGYDDGMSGMVGVKMSMQVILNVKDLVKL